MRYDTVTYPHTIVLRNTGLYKTAVGCTAVTRGSWQKKGVKDPGTSVEKRGAATRGGRDLDGEGPSRGRTRRWFSPRDHSRSLRNPMKKVSHLALLVLGPSRFLDFRVFSNPRTENSWAGSIKEERKRASQRWEGRDIVPFQNENPLKQRATLEWRAISAITTKKIVQDDISCSPPFLFPTLFAYSPFFLPRCQLLPEWWNPVVTWLPKNTSCIFSRDFRFASPRSPFLLCDWRDVCSSLSSTKSLFFFFRSRTLSRARVWFTSSRLLIEFDARSWYCLRVVADPALVSVSRWYCWPSLYIPTTKNIGIVTIVSNTNAIVFKIPGYYNNDNIKYLICNLNAYKNNK